MTVTGQWIEQQRRETKKHVDREAIANTRKHCKASAKKKKRKKELVAVQ
jgi:hypothetical protein